MKKTGIIFLGLSVALALLWRAQEYHWKWSSHKDIPINSKAYKRAFNSEILKTFVLIWPEEDRSGMAFSRNTRLGFQESVSFRTTMSMADAHNRASKFMADHELTTIDLGTWNRQYSVAYEYQDKDNEGSCGQIVIEAQGAYTNVAMKTY